MSSDPEKKEEKYEHVQDQNFEENSIVNGKKKDEVMPEVAKLNDQNFEENNIVNGNKKDEVMPEVAKLNDQNFEENSIVNGNKKDEVMPEVAKLNDQNFEENSIVNGNKKDEVMPEVAKLNDQNFEENSIVNGNKKDEVMPEVAKLNDQNFEENGIVNGNKKDEVMPEVAKLHDQNFEEKSIVNGNKKDEVMPEIGNGGYRGGVVLGVSWGERVLSAAHEALLQFGDDMKLYSFKINSGGFIHVTLDKLSQKYGFPDREDLKNYALDYKKRLEEIRAAGKIPNQILSLRVSSPDFGRLLKVPDDLVRFKDILLKVWYVEAEEKPEQVGIFLLVSVETESGECILRLPDVKENRVLFAEGKPLSYEQREWRLRVPFKSLKKVTIY